VEIAAGEIVQALAILEKLISFDTTSRNSNIELLAYVEEFTAASGATCRRVSNVEGTKANLLVRFGPEQEGGIVLSGHTDVVPVDGQQWTSDPFELTCRGDRLYGRGTSDMKSFIACAMAAGSIAASIGDLTRPLYLALTYDEEVGCFGAPDLIDVIKRECARIKAVIVGEPTGMKVVGLHKGLVYYRVIVTGHEAHSSLTHLGLSANAIAVRLMSRLLEIGDELVRNTDATSPFEPKHATITIGRIFGGTAPNILAGRCEFQFDLRYRREEDPDAILRPFFREMDCVNQEMSERFPRSGAQAVRLAAVPAFGGSNNLDAIELARALSKDTADEIRAVAFGSEAGQFQDRAFATAICGPGSIEQAHQPDEFIERAQIVLCMDFMSRLTRVLTQ